jgi:hypothetical protein
MEPAKIPVPFATIEELKFDYCKLIRIPHTGSSPPSPSPVKASPVRHRAACGENEHCSSATNAPNRSSSRRANRLIAHQVRANYAVYVTGTLRACPSELNSLLALAGLRLS